ncbi:hypothetical protein UFOVP53_71 [uncultured Caudovirales phage]|uniref:Uncharacterized protein n=1 Tax=uncultured Caudovirales phage TaxID=2100421 RepID=A0A6J5KY58_9CAUD|nr:hypothetical protein UFOVP53_71 [uncultured Caudovirales phage]
MSNHALLRGSSLHAPSSELVENISGTSILKLKVVSLNGMGTVYPKVTLCNPSINSPFGIAQVTIANTRSGLITCLGFMFSVDTHLWSVDTALYSDSSGNLSTIVNGNPIATVIKTDAVYGVLYVGGLGGTSPITPSIAEYFETVSKNLKSYPYSLNYTSGVLNSIVYTIDGSHSITKTFNYTLGTLTSLTLSGDTPTGIFLTKSLTYTGSNLTSVTYS